MNDQRVTDKDSTASAGAASAPAADPSAPLASGKPAGTRLGFSNYLGLMGALIAMIALFSVLSSHFLTYETFVTIANQIPDLVVMSVGMTFVLIIAGIDLSVGSVLALGASVVSVAALKWQLGPFAAAVLGLAAAALTGTVTGAVTVGWRIPSFIVSLGVLEAARGLAYQMTNSRTAYIGDAFDFLSNPIALGISPAFLIAVAVMIVAQLVLTRTVFGRYLVGIGTNEE
ncbi:MAG: ABC transporter permease, partial [Paraburkholderia hospita]